MHKGILLPITQNDADKPEKVFLQKLVTRHILFHLPDNEVVRV